MIETRIFEEPKLNRKEILRYARVKEETEQLRALLDASIEEARPLLSYKVCFVRIPVRREGETLSFGTIKTTSQTLSKALLGCDEAILFAATVGAQFDRLVFRYSKIAPAKALMLQALGAERAESLCDAFCEEMNTELRPEGKSLRTRVSPGYGDIPLLMQRDVFAVLDCPRKIGLTLNTDLLMSPSKSVTAVAGIKNNR